MGDSTLIRRRKGKRRFLWASLPALLILAGAYALYELEPFPPFWNDLLANLCFILAAGYSAAFAFFVFQTYEPADPPRAIWAPLVLGLWFWTLAEVLCAVYNMLYGEVGVTLADFFWSFAYLFFGAAVFLQYQLLYHPSPRLTWILFSLWSAATLALTALFVVLLSTFMGAANGLALWAASFYPAADFSIALAAARIAYRFRGGALGYPWLGLFVFAAADMMYAILDLGGFYSWSVNAGNGWSMATDMFYLSGYLIIALGCAAQWLLLRYGPIFGKKKRRAISS